MGTVIVPGDRTQATRDRVTRSEQRPGHRERKLGVRTHARRCQSPVVLAAQDLTAGVSEKKEEKDGLAAKTPTLLKHTSAGTCTETTARKYQMENSRNEPFLSFESHAVLRGVPTSPPAQGCDSSLRGASLGLCTHHRPSRRGPRDDQAERVTVPQGLLSSRPYSTRPRSQSTQAVMPAAPLCHREGVESFP